MGVIYNETGKTGPQSLLPMVVLGENLRSRQVALVSGYEKLQSDMGVIY